MSLKQKLFRMPKIFTDEIGLSIHDKPQILMDKCSQFLKSHSVAWMGNKKVGKNHQYLSLKHLGIPYVDPHIARLTWIFHALTGKMPKIAYDSDYDKSYDDNPDEFMGYSGKFYEFLIDLRPLLKPLGIDLGANSVIGDNGQEAIRQHKKILKELSIKIPPLE